MDLIKRDEVKMLIISMPYDLMSIKHAWLDELDKISSVEREKGKWIDGVIPNDNGGLAVIVCDKCDTFFPLAFGDSHRFCPNCGAKMESEE